MRFGNIELNLISEGTMLVDGGGMFGVVPRQLWHKKHPTDDINRITIEVYCLLVRGEGRTILVDTGTGEKLGRRTQGLMGIERAGELVQGLGLLGVDVASVDTVISTHLHFDHCGGGTVQRDGQIVPTFPNASYVVQKGEWEAASRPNARTRASYLAENMVPEQAREQLRLIEGEVEIAPFLHCIPTPGHTPHHQSVLIQSGGRKALYVADLAPLAVHIERPAWIAAYDDEPLRSLATKQGVQRQAVEEEMLLIFPHDPKIRSGYLRNEGGRLRVEPVDMD